MGDHWLDLFWLNMDMNWHYFEYLLKSMFSHPSSTVLTYWCQVGFLAIVLSGPNLTKIETWISPDLQRLSSEDGGLATESPHWNLEFKGKTCHVQGVQPHYQRLPRLGGHEMSWVCHALIFPRFFPGLELIGKPFYTAVAEFGLSWAISMFARWTMMCDIVICVCLCRFVTQPKGGCVAISAGNARKRREEI